MLLRSSALAVALTLVAIAGGPSTAAAQRAGGQFFLIPQVGAGTEVENVEQDTRRLDGSLDAWTLGAQLEYAIGNGWTPIASAAYWNVENPICDGTAACEEGGWGLEAGITRSFLPTSIFRPYGGGVVGVRMVGVAARYLQGRTGIDVAPMGSPITFRVEARYQYFMERGTPLFLLNTGIRFILPSP